MGEDAEYVYKFALQDCGLKEEDIVIFGRSMGSGPACFIAGTFNPGALCLMSAYTSIRSVAGDVFGFLSYLVAERFNNLEMIQTTNCPTFILHGSVDDVIPVHHGQALSQASKADPLVYIEPERMSHNNFRMS